MTRIAALATLLCLAAGCPRDQVAVAVIDGGERAEVADAGTAELVARRGVVELRRGERDWVPISSGARVGVSDGVRTPGEGEAELSVDGVRVKLYDRSEVRLTAAGSGVLRANVRGRVESDVQRGKGLVALKAEGSDAIAESRGGHFFLTAEGHGAVVATTVGEVSLASGAKTIAVGAGQSVRMTGDGIGPPVAALRRVLLAVTWPGQKTNRGQVPVVGRVAAGSRVYVQGQPVEVAPDGEFHTEVKLHDGSQRIAVVTVDPFGRTKTDSSKIIRDQSIPQVQMIAPWRRR